jgi:hypothetical protein
MTTTIDTTIPHQNHFPFTSTQAMATARLAETDQVMAQDGAGSRSVQFLVGPDGVGPVFTQDTEGSVSVSKP